MPPAPRWIPLLALVTATACTPILNIEGSFFPAWLLALVVGGLLTGLAWRLLVLAGLEAYLRPPLLVYPSLALLCTLIAWLVLFRS